MDDQFLEAQRALAEDWGFRCYEDALRSWIATVAIVEVGYVGEWEEYWDERFLAATEPQAEPMLRVPGEAGWWEYRRPSGGDGRRSEELDARDA